MFRSYHQSRTTSLLQILIFLLLTGCGGTTLVQYFTLDLPSPVHETREAATVPFYLSIKQLDSGLMYHEDRLIYHDARNEIKYWNYKKWIASPSVLLTEFLKRHLIRANLFYNVLEYPSAIHTRYWLEGKLNAFEERDTAQGWSVLVGLELRLFDSEQEKFIWEKSIENSQPVTSKTIEGVVAGFDAASTACVESVIVEIKAALEK